jgi:dihydroorotase-like cyclic amidohydrolase
VNYATRISGGRVFVGGQLIDADVLIDAGKIVALLRPGEAGSALESIDAS